MPELATRNLQKDDVTDTERQYQSVNVALFGRYMLSDKREFPCQVNSMSPGAALVVGPRSGEVGERIIAYMDHVGRLEGKILRTFPGGFAMTINATSQKREKLAATITWLANRHELSSPEDRRHERVTPVNSIGQIKLEDGRTYKVRIIDLSLSGAAFEIDVRPAIGTLVWLGKMRGRVVRHFDIGIAIEFAMIQTRESLLESAANMDS